MKHKKFRVSVFLTKQPDKQYTCRRGIADISELRWNDSATGWATSSVSLRKSSGITNNDGWSVYRLRLCAVFRSKYRPKPLWKRSALSALSLGWDSFRQASYIERARRRTAAGAAAELAERSGVKWRLICEDCTECSLRCLLSDDVTASVWTHPQCHLIRIFIGKSVIFSSFSLI